MKKIGGQVLVKETGYGIPNLVVAVFDSDLTIEDIRHAEIPATLLQRAGRRIGSVLTDRNGRFVLSRENLEFPGNEARPDLLLMVLAPEDVLDPERPFPLPAEQRMLYVSTVPRVDAGAEEAYVIRLLQEQLDRFGIPVARGERDAQADIRALAAPSLKAARFHDGVREALAARRKANRDATSESRRVSRQKTVGLSAIPAHLRSQKARDAAKLIEGKAELAKRLGALQKKVVEDAVADLVKLKTSPSMRLYVTEKELEALGLGVDGDTVRGQVKASALRDTIPGFGGVTDLMRVRGLEPPSPEELESRYLTSDEQPGVNASPIFDNPR